ncbi:MAG: hypothetical protein NVSMB31_08520 [Vulcanimicrobiaceae bacterium]
MNTVRPGTSNPGKITRSFGGVARNVAENLARLGVGVRLLSVVGDDADGWALVDDLKAVGVDTHLVKVATAHSTDAYGAMLDENGNLLLGISDLGALERLGPDDLEHEWPQLQDASWIFVDCNAPHLLQWLLARKPGGTYKIAVDAVSEAKGLTLPQDLTGIDLLVLNTGEAAAYLGKPDAKALDLAHALQARGVGAVVVTMGADGYVLGSEDFAFFTAVSASIVDVTGAGDAFIAATLYQLLAGDDLRAATRMGAVAAALTVESEESVRRDLSPRMLEQYTAAFQS